MIPSTQFERSDDSAYFDASSSYSGSNSLTSSQDPGYLPARYIHDSGADRVPYVCDMGTKNPFNHKAASSTTDSLEVANLEASITEQRPFNVPPDRVLEEPQRKRTPGTPQQDQNSFKKRTTDALFEDTLDLAPFVNEDSSTLDRTTSPTVGSVGRKTLFTNKEGLPVSSGTFINGAGTVGPHACTEAGDDLQRRARDADFSLTQKQKSKIVKAEAKDNQRLSKIIKKEAKVEKKALDLAIDELANLQRFQKQAVKDEAKAHANHAKVLSAFKKQESAFLESKSRHESLQGQVSAEAERLEAVRESAKTATEHVAEKSQEVDGLRKMFGIDEREREVRLGELKETKTSSLWKV